MFSPEKHTWSDSLEITGPIPDEVKVCGDRLNSCGIWWRAAFNHDRTEALGCRHAVKFRDRLGSGGNGGIPLWSELKSLVGVATESTTAREIAFAAHTRANTRFDEALLLKALGLSANARIRVVFDDDDVRSSGTLAESIDLKAKRISGEKWFGKVNPFNIDHILAQFMGQDVQLEDLQQILDRSLELDGGVPNTIMSNLGTRTTAFEVQPKDLILAVKQLSPKSFVASISEPCPVWLGLAGIHRRDYWFQFPPARGPKIGILTGNSSESGMTLWHDVLDALRDRYSYLADAMMPEIHIHSLPEMGLSMDLVDREEDVRRVVKKGVEGLLSAGCSIITFACNTTIYYEPEVASMCKELGGRFVSIAEACMPAVERALAQSAATRVGLVGIGPVVDMSGPFSGYKRHLEAKGIHVIACPADRLAFAVKSKGTGAELVTEFRRLLTATLPPEPLVVILALTELSMIYREHVAKVSKNRKSDKTFIDPLRELGRYIAFLYLSRGYRDCEVCQIPKDFDVETRLRARFGWT